MQASVLLFTTVFIGLYMSVNNTLPVVVIQIVYTLLNMTFARVEEFISLTVSCLSVLQYCSCSVTRLHSHIHVH